MYAALDETKQGQHLKVLQKVLESTILHYQYRATTTTSPTFVKILMAGVWLMSENIDFFT